MGGCRIIAVGARGRVGVDQLDADRALLIDVIHHGIADCDAAAERLAASPREDDRLVAGLWLKMRHTSGLPNGKDGQAAAPPEN